jgi:hypothetical protein
MSAFFGRAVLAALPAWLAACATVPDTQVREQLDEHTGVTMTRMAQALEFYSPRPERGLQATSFAYLGPLEVNRMGNRSTYLWLSVLPGTDVQGREAGALGAPQQLRLIIDNEPFEVAIAATAGQEINLGARAYRRPASWAHEAYLSAPPELLARLAAASSLLLEIDVGDGQLRRYDPWKADLSGLKAFIAQIAPASP